MTTVAWISLGVAFVCALWIAIDEMRRPQKMWIMNIVWPVTALYFSVVAVWAYYRWGLKKTKAAMAEKEKQGGKQEKEGPPKFPQIAVAASHCGAGCTIADVITEFSLAAIGLTILGSELWASYIFDFLAAWLLGVIFQYFTIAPMRNLGVGEGIVAAIKADTLSILAFQVGMYAWMALTFFVFYPEPHLKPWDPRYWLMMQIGMILGYFTAVPMNRWLVAKGLKERM